MKRCIFVLLMVLSVFLCSCDVKKDTPKSDKTESVVINMPTDDTVNGYRTKPKARTNVSKNVYYANKNTKKFHLKSCPLSSKIKSENLYTTNNRAELKSKGYCPCTNCKP